MTERPVVLVTGSNRGLGYGIAEAFHRAGYRVVSVNRTLLGLRWLGEVRCDLSRPDEVRATGALLRASLRRLDVCVLNAAVRRFSTVEKLTPESWEQSLAVNLSSAVYLIQETLPLVRAARGSYVLIGSHAATRFFEGGVAYSASKAALRAVVETLLLEERGNGVRAMLVSPGAIANRYGDASATKMTPASVGALVHRLVAASDRDIAIGEIEIRPAHLGSPPITGIERLQQV